MIDINELAKSLPEESNYIILFEDETGETEIYLSEGTVHRQLRLFATWCCKTASWIVKKHPEHDYRKVVDGILSLVKNEVEIAEEREKTVKSMMEEGISEELARSILKMVENIAEDKQKEALYEAFKN